MARLAPEERKKVQKPLLWIGMASIVMTFAGLTSGYVVSRSALKADSAWLEFQLPLEFTIATAAIVISSITMILARAAIRKDQQNKAALALAVTLALGLAFLVLQYLGWKDLIDRGLFFTGPESNTAISWVYVITVLHWAHVISGVIVVIVTLVNTQKGKYQNGNTQGFSVSAIYWHFLDALWIYLFIFLSFIR